jgi:hypothetical protein
MNNCPTEWVLEQSELLTLRLRLQCVSSIHNQWSLILWLTLDLSATGLTISISAIAMLIVVSSMPVIASFLLTSGSVSDYATHLWVLEQYEETWN